MSKLEEQLDPARFMRIRRSTIVNLDRVLELRTQPQGEALVCLDDGTQVRLSRSRREKLGQALARGL